MFSVGTLIRCGLSLVKRAPIARARLHLALVQATADDVRSMRDALSVERRARPAAARSGYRGLAGEVLDDRQVRHAAHRCRP